MDIRKFRKKLKRHQQGKANETENALIDAWYRSYAGSEDKIDSEELVRSRMAAREKISTSISSPKVYPFPLMQIAAAIALLICCTVLVLKLTGVKQNKPQYYTVSTGLNSVKQLILPDSTIVWLNSASSLQIPQNFKGKFRELILNEGEAFFDVYHDAARPFIVKTHALKVQVLGTSFNIQSFKNLNNTKIGVATGKVGVICNGKTLAMLTPGKELVFNKAKAAFNIKEIDIQQLQGWKTGSTYLTNASFDEVSQTVKNIYGVTLKPADKKISGYHFTLILRNGISVDDALKLITQIHNTHFKKEENEILIY